MISDEAGDETTMIIVVMKEALTYSRLSIDGCERGG